MNSKRIDNTKNNTCYKVKKRTVKSSRKGQIVGKYKMKSASKKVGKNFGYVLKELSKT